METLKATGTVCGVFFSLGTTLAASDPKFDCATMRNQFFSWNT